MTTKTRNWAIVSAAIEVKGETNCEVYCRAEILAGGQADPMPTSNPAAPFSITAA